MQSSKIFFCFSQLRSFPEFVTLSVFDILAPARAPIVLNFEQLENSLYTLSHCGSKQVNALSLKAAYCFLVFFTCGFLVSISQSKPCCSLHGSPAVLSNSLPGTFVTLACHSSVGELMLNCRAHSHAYLLSEACP